MELDKISFFRDASRRIEWLTARQEVISGNVANANTPAYKARDVAPFETLLNREPTGTLRLTHDRHLTGSQRGPVETRPDATFWEESLDGNTVVLEQRLDEARKELAALAPQLPEKEKAVEAGWQKYLGMLPK